mmetsp:Transcript_5348/g.15877  ORF Transcript_5348/g.15877 Transcript_5348/m.15877 type:complete len:334 (-) Transcript_5348:699-1700(-)
MRRPPAGGSLTITSTTAMPAAPATSTARAWRRYREPPPRAQGARTRARAPGSEARHGGVRTTSPSDAVGAIAPSQAMAPLRRRPQTAGPASAMRSTLHVTLGLNVWLPGDTSARADRRHACAKRPPATVLTSTATAGGAPSTTHTSRDVRSRAPSDARRASTVHAYRPGGGETAAGMTSVVLAGSRKALSAKAPPLGSARDTKPPKVSVSAASQVHASSTPSAAADACQARAAQASTSSDPEAAAEVGTAGAATVTARAKGSATPRVRRAPPTARRSTGGRRPRTATLADATATTLPHGVRSSADKRTTCQLDGTSPPAGMVMASPAACAARS